MSRKIKIALIAAVLIHVIFGVYTPSFAINEKYPQIEIGGYKRWLYQKYNVNPPINYFSALGSQEGVGGGGPWAEELNLLVDADLAKDVKLHYGLKQIPGGFELPDVRLDYLNYSLYYGYPQAIFGGQELILQDYPIGVGAGLTWGKSRLYFFSSKYPDAQIVGDYHGNIQFSDPKYTGDLSGSQYHVDNPYLDYLSIDLDRSDIDPDSIKLTADGAKLFLGTDYFFDEAYGLLLIARRYDNAKEIKLNYALKNGTPQDRSINLPSDGHRRAFLVSDMRLVEGTETVKIDNVRQTRDIDYRLNYQTRLLIMNNPLPEAAEVSIDFGYTAGQDLRARETISGQVGRTFVLAHRNIIRNTESIIKNGILLRAPLDYSINYLTQSITFTTALSAADTVEISYSFPGIRHDVSGGNIEYKLSDWSVLGASVISATPNQADSAIFDQVQPSSYSVGNIYNRATINKDTFINTELAVSSINPDYRGNTTVEADSAVKVFGKTRFGRLELNATYNKTGLNFASVQRVKLNNGWQEEKLSINLKYEIFNNLILHIGRESGMSQLGIDPTNEAKMVANQLGLQYMPIDSWKISYDIRSNEDGPSAGQTSQRAVSLYTDLDLRKLLMIKKEFSEEIRFNGKFDASNSSPNLGQGTIVSNKNKTYSIGCWFKFLWGLSGYVQDEIAEEANDAPTPLSVSRNTPYYKVSYKWDFSGGHNFLFYADYSDARQTGSTSYTKKENSYGINWNVPISNPALTAFSLGTTVKNTDYSDLNNSANDYKATEMAFQATMTF